ncbi:MAG: DUF1549 and DUF1553 domain-containing protein [Planctomycetaceae bacterium]
MSLGCQRVCVPAFVGWWLCGVVGVCPLDAADGLRVRPAEIHLDYPEASQQLLVDHIDGTLGDLTRRVVYQSQDPSIVVVTPSGQVLPRGEGRTRIVVQLGKTRVVVPVVTDGWSHPVPVSFRQEIIPILSKASCNSGGCHGKAEGQNGFKLSVFGFDPASDLRALVSESRGRRLSFSNPRDSLLLKKATAETPHGGGAKIPHGGLWHRRITRWISEGASLDRADQPLAVSIVVEPETVVMSALASQQLRVTAVDAAGRRRCVTTEAAYASNASPIAAVDSRGLIAAGDVPGEAAILVRYMNQVAICRVTLPRTEVEFQRPPEQNFIDGHAWNKLELLRIQPSSLTDDSAFMRRVFLDTIGTLPTVDEARAFLDDAHPRKRQALIDHLLERDEYADYWAMRWSDILRVDKERVTPQGAVAMTRWLRRQFHDNVPYDQFVTAVVTARGNTLSEGPVGFFQIHDKPEMVSRSISQLFLGVRIECAQCHHHPFEKWSQTDYFALAGMFTGVGRKAGPRGGQKIFSTNGADLKHPRSGQPVAAAGLGATPIAFADGADRRHVLAEWMTDRENPFLARMIVNRLWAHYFGRGLVEPIDDMRATNPATNAALLDALAEHLLEQEYDLQALTRTLLNSRLYQLSHVPNATNRLDGQNHSRAAWKALPAEVLLDAFCQATEVPEQFNGWPLGYRAIQIWDNRMPSYFFRVFGRPQRVSVCECERGNEPSIAQALHLMNSPESVRKIRHRDGRAARLAKSGKSDDQVIEELYLATLSRRPSSAERALMRQAFAESAGDRRAATEDILWTLLNCRAFVYNH